MKVFSCAADGVEPPPQNAREVLRCDQVGERLDGGRLDPALHQRRDSGMDLVAAQLQCAGGQGPRTGIVRKGIGAATPEQIPVNVLP